MRRVTGAVVLMGVAVCAATGCLSVRGEAAPERSDPAGPSRRAQAPPEGADTGPAVDRPQLREAPSRPLPRDAAEGIEEDEEHGSVPASPAVGEGMPHSDGTGSPPGSGAARGGPEPAGPVVRSPAVPRLPGNAGMCDLGRRYGGWAEGSVPEEVCERAYAD